MGRRDRPAKVKVVPRKPSLSVSSRESDGEGGSSSSTPCLHLSGSKLFVPGLVNPNTLVLVAANCVGLSWVSVLKGGGSSSATPTGGGPGGAMDGVSKATGTVSTQNKTGSGSGCNVLNLAIDLRVSGSAYAQCKSGISYGSYSSHSRVMVKLLRLM